MPMNELQNIIASLDRMEADAIREGLSNHFVQVTRTPNEVTVTANAVGMIHLSLQLLRIAYKGNTGSHFHLDEASVADSADTSIVFALTEHNWHKLNDVDLEK